VSATGPQPLGGIRMALLVAGVLMFVAQTAGAWIVAPSVTGPGDAGAGPLAALWVASIGWSSVTVLLLVRHAEVPDIATAAMLVVIAAYAAFTLSAALDVRDSGDAVNTTDALFLGVTAGGLTSVVVWGVALGAARLLRLPRGDELRG
jgi:hypothetical protein